MARSLLDVIECLLREAEKEADQKTTDQDLSSTRQTIPMDGEAEQLKRLLQVLPNVI